MDQYKGILKLEILGVQRGFKFGTMQTAIFCKEMNVKLSELAGVLNENNIEAQIIWYWSAAAAYSRLFKQEEPTKDEVAAWIDTYGSDRLESDATAANIVPNEEAPTNQGQ